MTDNERAIWYAKKLRDYCEDSHCYKCVFGKENSLDGTYYCVFRNDYKMPVEWDLENAGK